MSKNRNQPEHGPFESDLKAWLDDELESERAREVTRHVGGCERCQQLAADFELVGGLVGRLPEESPDQALALSAEIVAQVREEEQVARLVRGVAAAAAAVLVLSLGWLVGAPRPDPAVAQVEVDNNPLILVISDTPWEDDF